MKPTIWQLPELQLSLHEHELHIWKSSLRVNLQRVQLLKSLLSADELRRMERYYFDKDKNQFAVGRGILRVLLGKYLKVNPRNIDFHYNQYGKPFLSDQHSQEKIQFNLSHSKDLLLIAFAKNADVGIDVEYIRLDFDTLRLAKQFFSKTELKELFSIPSYLQKEAFFNCWTRKEAFIKAKGHGLSFPLAKFDVSLTPGKNPKLLRFDNNPNEVSDWFLHDIQNVEKGYIASAALNSHPGRIINWEYDGQYELINLYSPPNSESNSYIFN